MPVDGPLPVTPRRTHRRATLLVPLVLAAVMCAPACGPAHLRLPSGDSVPVADVRPMADEAVARCLAVTSITAELALSGRVGDQRIRGRVIAGIDRDAGLRLEAVAPFGAPIFVFAGRGQAATLLLVREKRVLTGERPEAILEAVIGVRLEPADLLDALAGCPPTSLSPNGGRAYGENWVVADSGDDLLYLQRVAGRWRNRAWSRGSLLVEYPRMGDGRPERVTFRVERPGGGDAVDLTVKVSGADFNLAIPETAFDVRVPVDAAPITLEELRAAGPMAGASVR